MLYDVVVAAIRTGVASAVGALAALLIAQGVDVPDDFASSVSVVAFGVAAAAYNAAVNFLAVKVHPAFGYLLGVAKAPTYDR